MSIRPIQQIIAWRKESGVPIPDSEIEELRTIGDEEFRNRFEREREAHQLSIDVFEEVRKKQVEERRGEDFLRFVPPVYRPYVDILPPEPLLSWLDSGNSALIYGDNGRHKTTYAWSYLKHRVSQDGVSWKYSRAYEMLARIKRSEDWFGVLEEYKKPDILVIDEIDKTFETNIESQIISELIIDRFDWEKQTIVIGNVLPIARDTLGKAVYFRLSDGRGKVYEIK